MSNNVNIMLYYIKPLNEKRSGEIDKSPRKINLEEKESCSCTSKDYSIQESSTSVLLTDIIKENPSDRGEWISPFHALRKVISERFYPLNYFNIDKYSLCYNSCQDHLSTCN